METVVINESRGKKIRLLLLMLGAAVLCMWAVATPETTFQPHKRYMKIVLSAIALPFLAAGIGIILGRLVRPRPLLVLTAEGFEFSSGFRNLRFIPWQEVSDISLIKIRSAKILGYATGKNTPEPLPDKIFLFQSVRSGWTSMNCRFR